MEETENQHRQQQIDISNEKIKTILWWAWNLVLCGSGMYVSEMHDSVQFSVQGMSEAVTLQFSGTT